MVVIRKPVQRSENLVDRRDITRRGYESVEAYMMMMKRKHEAEMKRKNEMEKRAQLNRVRASRARWR